MRPTVMQLQLLLLLSLSLSLALPRPPSRNIIKVRASGFLPFESDLLLPLGILRQLQAQDRASRLLPPHPPRRRVKPKPKPKPKPKQQVRLERAHAQNGMQLYNLIDDDGELLLNLRVHTENGNGGSKQNSLNTLEEEQQETPWRPSKWRPTSAPPLLLQTSSSPRPLPLHQYLESNSLEQHQSQSPSTQQRRMFGLRADWNYK